jgi:hypothetical protein
VSAELGVDAVRAWCCLALGVATGGCSVELSWGERSAATVNQCESDDECGPGRCLFGACVASRGDVDAILMEVTPPASALGIGGARVLTVLEDLSESRRNLVLDVPRLASIQGFVKAATPCSGEATSTLPVSVTITPSQRFVGISGGAYTATATKRFVGQSETSRPCASELSVGDAVYDFHVNVPPGEYDVYIEPAEGEAETCQFAPAVIRRSVAAGGNCLALGPFPPRTIPIVIEWPGDVEGVRSLEGWIVDVIHPITGQRLSVRETISKEWAFSSPTGGIEYRIDLDYSNLGTPGSELIRLSPPEGVLAPVIRLALSGLIAADVAEARIGKLDLFPAPVQLEAWVWRETEFERSLPDVPVAATVTLTATELDGIEPGIFASFSTTIQVTESGRLSVAVMPGEYRVRVVPEVGSGLSAFETTLEAPCVKDPTDPSRCIPRESNEPIVVQAGKTILVPDAATVTARLVSPFDIGAVEGAQVVGLPALMRIRRCEVDAGECTPTSADVLDLSLGEDAFVPRTATSLVEHGAFTIDGADCAFCEPGLGAVYDFYVRPQDGSGYPWALQSGVEIAADTDLGAFPLSLPILHRGTVQVPQGETAVPIAGALLRAYVARDAFGRLVDPSLPACAETSRPTKSACVLSLLQVAETRAGDDGAFDLFLPSRVE